MQKILALVIILFLCTGAEAGIIIAEFCPDPYLPDDADEYITLSGYGPLDGITVSDGRGGFRFPPGTIINGTLTVAQSGSAFRQSHARLPDFEWIDSSPQVPDVIPGDRLRLANSRDMLLVYENGRPVQNISWPGDIRPREGQVHYLENRQWDPRPLMLGQSRFSRASFSDVAVTAFVLPDASGEIFTSVVRSAEHEILLNVYEFSSPAIADALVEARKRNVAITVLVEGGPVGGITPEEKNALFVLNRSGIPVYAMLSSKGEHAPYRYDHAKYLVIDRHTVLVTSENFKYSGFPQAGNSGNRGWGVVLEDRDLASYFASVFAEDVHSPSVKPYPGTPGTPERAPPMTYRQKFLPCRFTGATVRPVLAPDTNREIIDLIDSAQTSIQIEQAYITNESGTELNPYLAGAINASRRGVRVRILLDSYWYNTEDNADNDEMTVIINRIANDEQLPLEARCADLSASGFAKIHNKGVIVDDRKVLVSSINWNSNSPNFNRETGVIIDHPGVARYFREAFDEDWAPAVKSDPEQTPYLKILLVMVVVILLIALYYRRHIR